MMKNRTFSERAVNLHTHTPYCKHASGTPEICGSEALKQNLAVLGFSEHAPFPDDSHPGDRMVKADLPGYFSFVEKTAELFPDLTVLRGLELDYVEDMLSYRKSFLDEFPCDYLIGSAHRVWLGGKEFHFCMPDLPGELVPLFFRADLEILECPFIDILAHPDAAACHYTGRFTKEMADLAREIARTAKAKSIPLEVNANGIRKKSVMTADGPRWAYPWRVFWEIVAEEDPPVIVSSDAHNPSVLADDAREKAFCFAEELGLNIVNASFARKIIERKTSSGGNFKSCNF